MNDLRDRLQELADGYARTTSPPGPAAARRRGRSRRRRTVAGVVLAGLLVVAVVAGSVGLLPALKLPRPAAPVGPGPTPAPLQVPGPRPGSRRPTCPAGSGSSAVVSGR